MKKPMICFICDERHFTKSSPSHPNNKGSKRGKEINDVDQEVQEFALNKSDSIYVNFQKYLVVLDSGSEDNYISKELADKFKTEIKKLKNNLIRYSVDNRKIEITQFIDLPFIHDKRQFTTNFYILPGTRKDKIILGRKWMKWASTLKRYECSIKTPAGAKVIEATWSLPHKLREGTDKAIEAYEKKGYIRDSHSTWCNNIRPVEKEDGSVRIATNLIALNKLVELDNYSLPNMDEILSSLNGQEYFSKIDLKDGFFQIPLKEEDKHKTAFRHTHKLKEWNVMPMGFKNAPATFQRFMDNVLKNEIGKSCWCYVDDILIFGKTEKEHDENLERIKQILNQYKLEINEKKSEYKKPEIVFLGHKIKKNVIQKELDCREAIEKYPSPGNKTEVQQFLGLINYYRKFIKNVTKLCEPLYELLRKNETFVWTGNRETAFRELKNELLKPAILHQPDFDKLFILETDACNTGLGAILSQEFDGQEYPIAYASRMLSRPEVNYSISEKECLGAIYGMEKFKYYLYGREFLLRTDHKALEKLNNGPIKSARIERWCERLQNFSFKVEYKKGELIPHVDALSRMYNEINEIVNPDDVTELCRKTHEELLHRGAKAVVYRLHQKGFNCPERKVKDAIKDCMICKAFNPKKIKGYKFIQSFERGEKVGFDLMESPGGEYIITAIDYFTREGFAKRIPNRESKHILSFLQKIHEQLKIKLLISDGARENTEKKVKDWLVSRGIKHHVTSAHHSESNGRIERFNKTILDGLRKGNLVGLLQNRLQKILEQYHNTYHEGLGMTPNEAKDFKNWNKIKEMQFKKTLENYVKKFKSKEWDKLEKGQKALLKKEVGKTKGDPIFENEVEIVEDKGCDSYLVKQENGRLTKRHISQLKGIRPINPGTKGMLTSTYKTLNKYP